MTMTMTTTQRLRIVFALTPVLPGCVLNVSEDAEDSDGVGTTGDGAESSEGSGDTDAGLDDSDSADETQGTESTCVNAMPSTFTHAGGVGDETWGPGIHIVDNVTVTGALEVEPCAVLRMVAGADMTVTDAGSVAMLGEPDARILVTSDSESSAAGDWGRIRITDGSVGLDNVFSHVDIEFGGGSVNAMVQLENGASMAMTDCTVRASQSVGLRAEQDAELREFEGNEFTNNGEAPLRLHPTVVGDVGPGTYLPNGVAGIVVADGVVNADAIWLGHDAPYLLNGLLLNAPRGSAHLTIEAGATLRMGEDTGIRVAANGGLTLAGTAEAPVVIESSKASGAPGDWEEIRIEAGSVDALNDFDHVDIRHGGGGQWGAIRVASDASLAMTNTSIRFTDGPGLNVNRGGDLRDFEGNTLTDNLTGAIQVPANNVDQLGVGIYGPNVVEGIFIDDDTVDHDALWMTHEAPYVLLDHVTVETDVGSAALTIAAGAELRISEGGRMPVGDNGSLTMAGTQDERIRVTSAKASPSAGDWDEFRIESGSAGPSNLLSYVDIEYGGGGPRGQVWVQTGAEMTFEHVAFSESGSGCDVEADGETTYTDTPVTECP
ncbi:MAG: hypothetical protein JKY37_32785 [Nannocystaceae bacterium]|nr:hypothetical protein [Nannocystaceae bacterium]